MYLSNDVLISENPHGDRIFVTAEIVGLEVPVRTN